MATIRRSGMTLLELLVVLAILAVISALLLPAIQKVRAAAQNASCQNNIKQIGLALHGYHDTYQSFPPGVTTAKPGEPFPRMGWLTRLLPYVEQGPLWSETQRAYAARPNRLFDPAHPGLITPLALYSCPADWRVQSVQRTYNNWDVSLGSYLGVSGVDYRSNDGVLYANSHVRIVEIADGTSSTLAVGERPPSPDYWYGWWYAGEGQLGSGSADLVLGVRELRIVAYNAVKHCPSGPYHYEAGLPTAPCDAFHFWSFHSGGGHFGFADGSVHFLSYAADRIFPPLSTRAGNEVISGSDL